MNFTNRMFKLCAEKIRFRRLHFLTIFFFIESNGLKVCSNSLELSLEGAGSFGVPSRFAWYQGFNARKVISEVYASFVLQCTVSGR